MGNIPNPVENPKIILGNSASATLADLPLFARSFEQEDFDRSAESSARQAEDHNSVAVTRVEDDFRERSQSGLECLVDSVVKLLIGDLFIPGLFECEVGRVVLFDDPELRLGI